MVTADTALVEPDGPTRNGAWLDLTEDGVPLRFWIAAPPDPIDTGMQATGTLPQAPLLRAVRPALPPLARIVDAGADHGSHTLFFAKVCRAVEVIPFEGDEAVLPALRANLRANGCDNVNDRHLGVPLWPPSARRPVRADADGLTAAAPSHAANHAIVRLDAVLSGPVDLIRIAGSDSMLRVLEGAAGIVAACRPDILVEVGLPEMPGLTDWIAVHGYRVSFAYAECVGVTHFLLQPRRHETPDLLQRMRMGARRLLARRTPS